MGATWVAITPFGRVADLSGSGVDLTLRGALRPEPRRDVARAIAMAHARGLRVMLVPHLWVESGEWRALIDPKTDDGWARWAESYRRFVLAWAEVAAGVARRHASRSASSFAPGSRRRARRASRAVIADVRRVYRRRPHLLGELGRRRRTPSSSATSTSSASTRSTRSPTTQAPRREHAPRRRRAGARQGARARGALAASPCSSPRSATRRAPTPRCARGSGPTR